MTGPRPSRYVLPPGPWTTVLDGLVDAFPQVGRPAWRDRMADGLVLADDGVPIEVDAPYRVGLRVRYFRHVPDEPVLPFAETILYQDDDLLVADKPHFLPVAPAGRFVRQCLLHRLREHTGFEDLAPLHRIDRLTAGLVMFSLRRQGRDGWWRLFSERRVCKGYEAVAPALPDLAFPMSLRTRIEPGEPFFCMRQVDGEANAQTSLQVLARGSHHWLYGLAPHTGRKHQLRVQMAGLGAPILHDPWYPEPGAEGDDFHRPLQLLARSLAFADPRTGRQRYFQSAMTLAFDPRRRTLGSPPMPAPP